MIDKIVEYFQENGVICKKVEDSRTGYGDLYKVIAWMPLPESYKPEK